MSDARGQPVEGATVHLEPRLEGQGFAYLPKDPTETTADGLFRFEGVLPGQHALLVTSDGRVVGWQFLHVAGAEAPEVVVALPDTSGKIVGRITDRATGAPLKGVSVLAVPPVVDRHLRLGATPAERAMKWCADPYPHAKTGADGSYSLGPLPPGRYAVIAVGVEFPTASAEVVVPRRPESQVRVDFARVPSSARRLAACFRWPPALDSLPRVLVHR